MSQTVSSRVRYINQDWKARKDIPCIGSGESRREVTSYKNVRIYDARERVSNGTANLDASGFTLSHNLSSVKDFHSGNEIRDVYHTEMKKLICELTGAKEAYIYNHLIRTEKPTGFNDAYARFVHCDWNLKNIDDLAKDVLAKHGLEAESNFAYAFFNTWQPIDHIVENNPLAFIDWATLPFDDVIDYYYTGHGSGNIKGTGKHKYLVAAPVYNPEHQFFYFPEMSTEEVLVMKQLDARPNRSVYCPHTSFNNHAPEDARPRRSIETRLLAIFQSN